MPVRRLSVEDPLSISRGGWRESVRRGSECALLGVLWFGCSIPLVTAGAAWSAVAEICRAWSLDEEPPLLPTFLRAVRRELLPGLAMSVVLLLVTVLPYVEGKVALGGHLPAAWAESIGLGLLAAACLGVLLLAFPAHAADRCGWLAAVRDAARLAARRPWVPLTALIAVVVGILLVEVFPPLIVLMAGPVGYAVSAAYARGQAVTA
jgi:uncharacterized membrane protein YesL